MNNELQAFARQSLKEGLAKLTKGNHLVFKRMYANDDLDADINDVVDALDADKLDRAMQQVQRSVDIQER